jgi:hypothetical protein
MILVEGQKKGPKISSKVGGTVLGLSSARLSYNPINTPEHSEKLNFHPLQCSIIIHCIFKGKRRQQRKSERKMCYVQRGTRVMKTGLLTRTTF